MGQLSTKRFVLSCRRMSRPSFDPSFSYWLMCSSPLPLSFHVLSDPSPLSSKTLDFLLNRVWSLVSPLSAGFASLNASELPDPLPLLPRENDVCVQRLLLFLESSLLLLLLPLPRPPPSLLAKLPKVRPPEASPKENAPVVPEAAAVLLSAALNIGAEVSILNEDSRPPLPKEKAEAAVLSDPKLNFSPPLSSLVSFFSSCVACFFSAASVLLLVLLLPAFVVLVVASGAGSLVKLKTGLLAPPFVVVVDVVDVAAGAAGAVSPKLKEMAVGWAVLLSGFFTSGGTAGFGLLPLRLTVKILRAASFSLEAINVSFQSFACDSESPSSTSSFVICLSLRLLDILLAQPLFSLLLSSKFEYG
mmetsp:Transcript_9887/g.18028  ORF Transcript_9887/g.18028 Transcript_9887/m.18028 type:complete len:360 (-) Transcript_9887:66-1145(-)